MATPADRTVVLLPGLGRTPASFWRMQMILKNAGLTTLPLVYHAWKGGPGTLCAQLEAKLPDSGVLDFVGHSLGGLLALRLSDALPDARRGRVVQLGTPNLGSAAATRARPLGQILGPIIENLEPHDQPPAPHPNLLAIAGTAAPGILTRVTGVEGQNDGLVDVKSALAVALPENTLVLPVTHTLMMMDRRVIDATLDFLQDGKLDPVRVAAGYD